MVETQLKKGFVSVVVCTYNGSAHIAKTLEALKVQTYPSDAYEIIVVDDGSTDDTNAIVEKFHVRLIRHDKNMGLGVGRNTGIHAARGEIIAYTDDDCLPSTSWLEHLVAPYADPLVIATGGRTFAVSRSRPTERYMDASGYGNPAPYDMRHGNSLLSRLNVYVSQMVSPLHLAVRDGQLLHAVYTLNASYRIKQLREIGGFDQNLRASEDSDVSARLYAAHSGYKIVFAELARVGHRHRRAFWPWVLQTFERSQDGYIQARKESRIPAVFPFPLAWLVIAATSLVFSPLAGLVALVVAPIALYWWWQLRLAKSPLLDRIRFPYMQFLLESATLLGYATAFVRNKSGH